MTLLVSFLCRFGWGMAIGLLLTPAGDVPAGFFRVNLLVVMGLATLAALAAAQAWPIGLVCVACGVARSGRKRAPSAWPSSAAEPPLQAASAPAHPP